jgi:hypothetical protein
MLSNKSLIFFDFGGVLIFKLTGLGSEIRKDKAPNGTPSISNRRRPHNQTADRRSRGNHNRTIHIVQTPNRVGPCPLPCFSPFSAVSSGFLFPLLASLPPKQPLLAGRRRQLPRAATVSSPRRTSPAASSADEPLPCELSSPGRPLPPPLFSSFSATRPFIHCVRAWRKSVPVR